MYLSTLEGCLLALSIEPPKEWKVEISTSSGRFFLKSSTEAFEKDRHNISWGSIPFFSIRYLTFALTVNVFPQPAPAIICELCSFRTTANLWLSSNDLPSISSRKSLCSSSSFWTYFSFLVSINESILLQMSKKSSKSVFK